MQSTIESFSVRLAMSWAASALLISAAAAQDAKPPIQPLELKIYPLDVAVNKDTAYVADRRMHGVWKWAGGELSELFRGSPKFRTPLNATRTVAIDHKGNVLVGDSATREIYRFVDGKPEPITGGKIGTPADIAVAKDGTIYVADLELHKVMKIAPDSAKVEHFADVNPRGLCVDSKGTLWVVSQNDEQLLTLDSDGKATAVVKKRTFNFPHQVAVNSGGEAFVTDGYEKAIWRVVPGKEPEVWFKGEPLDNPVGITLVDDLPVVVDPRVRKVFKFSADAKPTVWFEIAEK
ncbi:MAG TPA: hypothetical protein DDW52_17580 [Planctomycetaceae bacterium]|nr:hypothetical protein [Planctomycetaceae bacterium]